MAHLALSELTWPRAIRQRRHDSAISWYKGPLSKGWTSLSLSRDRYWAEWYDGLDDDFDGGFDGVVKRSSCFYRLLQKMFGVTRDLATEE